MPKLQSCSEDGEKLLYILTLLRAAGAPGEPEGGRGEQHGVRGECSDPGPRLRVRRHHLPASKASERAEGRACPCTGGADQRADPARESNRHHLHGDGQFSAAAAAAAAISRSAAVCRRRRH